MKKVEVAEKAVNTAQTFILVYSTIVAVHGVINYGKAFGEWVNKKRQEQTKSNLRIIKGGE